MRKISGNLPVRHGTVAFILFITQWLQLRAFGEADSFWPHAVDLSGTEALGPLSSSAVLQPPAPMPRKSQTVSGRAPPFLPWCWCSGPVMSRRLRGTLSGRRGGFFPNVGWLVAGLSPVTQARGHLPPALCARLGLLTFAPGLVELAPPLSHTEPPVLTPVVCWASTLAPIRNRAAPFPAPQADAFLSR